MLLYCIDFDGFLYFIIIRWVATFLTPRLLPLAWGGRAFDVAWDRTHGSESICFQLGLVGLCFCFGKDHFVLDFFLLLLGTHYRQQKQLTILCWGDTETADNAQQNSRNDRGGNTSHFRAIYDNAKKGVLDKV